ncbi:ATP-binding protein [Bdellovibrionota bacterium FG-1]
MKLSTSVSAPFYGRAYEEHQIQTAIHSKRAELGIVYGRRRIGKSRLIKQFVKRKGDLYFEALGGNRETEGAGAHTTPKQIAHFVRQLAEQTDTPLIQASTWQEAFDAFTRIVVRGKHYVVFDEFPWMAAERTELVAIVKYYWDRYWSENPDFTLVLCGSIMSYMVKHVVHSQILHNRKTFELKLEALPAFEAKKFFGTYRSQFEISKFLMIFGGIPKYLEQINPKLSLADNLDHLCFQRNGFFVTEFETVFKEQFKVTKTYEEIVAALSKKSATSEELAKVLKKKTRSAVIPYLSQLERADFIKKFSPTPIGLGAGKKTLRYVLWDDWLRFYFIYVQPHLQVIQENTEKGLFNSITDPSIEGFFGRAFENLCFKNLSNIIRALGIPKHQVVGYGPYFKQASRKPEGLQEGLQIDALIQRKGHVLVLIECKYHSGPVRKSVIEEVERKVKFLKAPSKYTVEKVLITANGVTPDVENAGYFHHILGLDAVMNEG